MVGFSLFRTVPLVFALSAALAFGCNDTDGPNNDPGPDDIVVLAAPPELVEALVTVAQAVKVGLVVTPESSARREPSAVSATLQRFA